MAVWFLFLGLLGAAMGSFLNAVSLRLQQKKSFINSRSACPHCHHQLAWFDLIPLISFLMLRGSCRYCKETLSQSYVLAEIIMMLLFLLQTFFWLQGNGDPITLIRNLFVLSTLAFLFIHDLRFYLLPDLVTIPAVIIVFFFNFSLGISVKSMLYGIIIGGGFFLFQYLLSRGKWIGDGDIRMGALIGVLFGWPLVLVSLMLSYLFGTAVAIPLLVSGKKQFGAKLPFGTFLALGGVVTLWWGEQILSWYLSFL